MVHEYYVVYTGNASGSSLEGSVEGDPIAAFVNDEVNPDSIERIPVYEGVTYVFDEIDPAEKFTLTGETAPTITLKYKRAEFVPFPPAGIKLTKSAPETAELDGTFAYTLKVEAVNYTAVDVTITDTLPAGV